MMKEHFSMWGEAVALTYSFSVTKIKPAICVEQSNDQDQDSELL